MEFIQFGRRNSDLLLRALSEHVQMVFTAVALSVLLAGLICVAAMYSRRFGAIATYLFSAVYSIPSIALFALMIPLLGLGRSTAVTVLVLYNQFVLLRNFIAGLNGVDPAAIEAAKGMGMTAAQIIFKIRVPLSLKPIFVGIRLALVSTIAISIIAAFIGAGGIGLLITIGLETGNNNRVLWGVVLSVGLGIVASAALRLAEKRLG